MKRGVIIFVALIAISGMLFLSQSKLAGMAVSENNQTNQSIESSCEPPEVEIAERNLLTLSRLNKNSLENIDDKAVLNSFCNRCLNMCNQELPPNLKEHLSRFLLKELRNSLNDVRVSERVFDKGIAGFNNEDSQVSFSPSINNFEDLQDDHDFSITKGCLRASFSGSMNILEGVVKPKAEINLFDFVNINGDVKLDFKNERFNEWGCSLNFKINW